MPIQQYDIYILSCRGGIALPLVFFAVCLAPAIISKRNEIVRFFYTNRIPVFAGT